MELYELELNEGRRISPFVWRVRMALAHKQIVPECIGIGFGDKDRIAFSGQQLVPVIRDGDVVVSDSWKIACYLEDTYPDAPSLFGGAIGRGMARFVSRWADINMLNPLAGLLMPCVYDHVPERDRDYFRADREARFGMTLEEMRESPDAKIEAFRKGMAPVRVVLREQQYICGEAPAFADYCIFGGFMWARGVSEYHLLSDDDPIYAWREKMMAKFDGLAAGAPGYAF